jgi:hypothetical protein
MKILFSFVLSLALMVSQACADIMLTTTPGLSFEENSGTQSFQLLAQAAPSDAAIVALLSTVTIDSGTAGLGVFTIPISYASNFNAANVNVVGSSGVLDPIDPRIAYLSLDFTSPQAIPTGSPGVFGTFTFNVNGLSPGFYGILLSDAASDGPNVVTTNGGFTITTAIPEPTSILTTSLLVLGATLMRRPRVTFSSSKKTSAEV